MLHVCNRLVELNKRFFSNAVEIHRLGNMNFLNALSIQKKLISDPLYSCNDYLLFVEHPSVYTCGRRHFKDIDEYVKYADKTGVKSLR